MSNASMTISKDSSESMVHLDEQITWVENVEQQFNTKKFSELQPGVYSVIPLRRINTKFGKQLICMCTATQCTKNTHESSGTCEACSAEYLVPNSFVKQMIATCGDVEHKCMLKMISTDLSTKVPKYKFQIGKLKDNPIVSIERPIQESLW